MTFTYAPGPSAPPCRQLTTVFNGNHTLSSGATLYFDLDAQVPMTIQGLELNLVGTSAGQIEVYTCVGTRSGKQTLPAEWTLVSRRAVAPAGQNLATLVPITPFSIPAGITRIALHSIGIAQRFSSFAAAYSTSTPELTLRAGEFAWTLFGGTPELDRTANCRLCHAPAGSPWAGRTLVGAGCPAAGASTWYQSFIPNTFDLGTPDNTTSRSIRMSRSGNGYRLVPGSHQWHVPATGDLGLLDDGLSAPLPLPWQFPFPLGSTNALRVNANGVVWPTNQADSAAPLTAELIGGGAAFAVTWDRARMYANPNGSVTAQIVFLPNGDVEMRWKSCMRDGSVLVAGAAATAAPTPAASTSPPFRRPVTAPARTAPRSLSTPSAARSSARTACSTRSASPRVSCSPACCSASRSTTRASTCRCSACRAAGNTCRGSRARPRGAGPGE